MVRRRVDCRQQRGSDTIRQLPDPQGFCALDPAAIGACGDRRTPKSRGAFLQTRGRWDHGRDSSPDVARFSHWNGPFPEAPWPGLRDGGPSNSRGVSP